MCVEWKTNWAFGGRPVATMGKCIPVEQLHDLPLLVQVLLHGGHGVTLRWRWVDVPAVRNVRFEPSFDIVPEY